MDNVKNLKINESKPKESESMLSSPGTSKTTSNCAVHDSPNLPRNSEVPQKHKLSRKSKSHASDSSKNIINLKIMDSDKQVNKAPMKDIHPIPQQTLNRLYTNMSVVSVLPKPFDPMEKMMYESSQRSETQTELTLFSDKLADSPD